MLLTTHSEGGGQVLEVDWIIIPAGRLVRGTPAEDIDDVVTAHSDLGLPRDYFAKEAPQASVAVPGFAMSRVPVTVDQWRAFVTSVGLPSQVDDQPGSHPIDGIPWAAASRFCRWAAQQLGLPIRLPTELEWERAARGDDARIYPWGDQFDARLANLAEHGLGHAAPVGSLSDGASPFGILDMAGNVDEWTATLYSPYPGAPAGIPAVEGWAVDPHITRGGDYKHHRDLARCARRHSLYPPRAGAGFRLVYTP